MLVLHANEEPPDFKTQRMGSRVNAKAQKAQGIAAPRFIPRVDHSNQAAYIDAGYPALMVTDTAPYRYPPYHTRQDNPDQVDFDRLARVVQGLEKVIQDLALQR